MLDSQQPADDAPIDWPAECARIIASLTPEEMAARRKRTLPHHRRRHLWAYVHEDPLLGGEPRFWHPYMVRLVFNHILNREFEARRIIRRFGWANVFVERPGEKSGEVRRELVGQAHLGAAVEHATRKAKLAFDLSFPPKEDAARLLSSLDSEAKMEELFDNPRSPWVCDGSLMFECAATEYLSIPDVGWVRYEVSTEAAPTKPPDVVLVEGREEVELLVALKKIPRWRLHSDQPPLNLTPSVASAPPAADLAGALRRQSSAPAEQPPATTQSASESQKDGAAGSTSAGSARVKKAEEMEARGAECYRLGLTDLTWPEVAVEIARGPFKGVGGIGCGNAARMAAKKYAENRGLPVIDKKPAKAEKTPRAQRPLR